VQQQVLVLLTLARSCFTSHGWDGSCTAQQCKHGLTQGSNLPLLRLAALLTSVLILRVYLLQAGAAAGAAAAGGAAASGGGNEVGAACSSDQGDQVCWSYIGSDVSRATPDVLQIPCIVCLPLGCVHHPPHHQTPAHASTCCSCLTS
jgi:hypothetical protein